MSDPKIPYLADLCTLSKTSEEFMSDPKIPYLEIHGPDSKELSLKIHGHNT